MERQEKRTLILRLMAIYVCYLIVIGAGFIHSVLPLFKAGFDQGVNAAEEYLVLSQQGIERKWYLFPVRPVLLDDQLPMTGSQYDNVQMNISAAEAIAAVTVTTKTGEHNAAAEMISNCYTHTMLLSTAGIVAWLAILVLIGVIINSLRRSIRDQRTLPDSNIIYLRIIGGLIIVRELLSAMSYNIGQRTVAMISDGGVEFSGSFPVEYGYVVLGLLVLFSAEVYAIGSLLSEEQKLTI